MRKYCKRSFQLRNNTFKSAPFNENVPNLNKYQYLKIVNYLIAISDFKTEIIN